SRPPETSPAGYQLWDCWIDYNSESFMRNIFLNFIFWGIASVGFTHLFERLERLRPGACGLPCLGEESLEACTISSNSDFGTRNTFRMTALKCWNSGVELNEARFTPSFYSFSP